MSLRKRLFDPSQADRIEALLERLTIAVELAVGIQRPAPEASDRNREQVAELQSDALLVREEWDKAMQHPDASSLEDAERKENELDAEFRHYLGMK